MTPKSAPPRKPSLSPSPIGPGGRGRPTPAWQKTEGMGTMAGAAPAGHGRGSPPRNLRVPTPPSIPERTRPRAAGVDAPRRRNERRRQNARAVSRSRRRAPRYGRPGKAELKRSERDFRPRPQRRRRDEGRLEGRRGERQRPGAERPEARAEDLVECSVHGKKRSWDKIEVTAEKKWVCVASCPCVVHLGGTKGWCHFLRDALRSRGEDELLEAVEALAASDEAQTTSGHGAAQEAPSAPEMSSNLEAVLPASPLLEGEIDPDDL